MNTLVRGPKKPKLGSPTEREKLAVVFFCMGPVAEIILLKNPLGADVRKLDSRAGSAACSC